MAPTSLLLLIIACASFCQAEEIPKAPLLSSRRSLSSLIHSRSGATNDKVEKIVSRELAGMAVAPSSNSPPPPKTFTADALPPSSSPSGPCPATCPDESTCQLLSGAPTCKCPFPTYSRLLNNKCTIGPLRHWGYLDALNDARIAVGSPQLTWNFTLAQQAQAWANSLAVTKKCGLGFNTTGQNVINRFQASSFQNFQAMNLWVAQGGKYKLSPFANKGAGGCKTGKWSDCSAYTQVVWRASTQVGCGMGRCGKTRGKVWVCNFFPPGNIPGQLPY